MPDRADADRAWPSQQRRAWSAPKRSDGRRSRDALLRAAGRLLAEEKDFTLQDVAREAGVARATAYRHFRSAHEISAAFIAGFLDDVEQRTAEAAPATDVDGALQRLSYINTIWVQAVLDWGPALAHLRSSEGFLARRRRDEPEMHRSLRHVEPAFLALLTCAGGRAPDEDALAYVLAAWNALSDPREVLDLAGTLGWGPERIAAQLQRSVAAIALRAS